MVIAAGIESMTRVPMGSTARFERAFTDGAAAGRGVHGRYPDILFSQFAGAEMMARKYEFDRETLDRYGLESHRRVARATEAGAFKREIVPLRVSPVDSGSDIHAVDEGIRFDASLEKIGAVRTPEEGGVVTAANASQICDGASAMLMVSERALKDHGLTPIARVHHMIVTAGDPV